MSIALSAGFLVATILFLAGLSLGTLRWFSKQDNLPELLEDRNSSEDYPG
jgi:hypothetical protein